MREMNIENVRVNSVVLVGNTCSKHGNSFGWEKMMANKKTITDNTVTYNIEVNNGFKDNVTFRFLNITKKVIKKDGERHEYFEVLMEDVDNEFGKIACRASEIRNTKSLKNKLTNEYRRTLTIKNDATKDLKKDKEQLTKDLDEQKAIATNRSIENSILKADKVLLEGQIENQLMIIQEQKNEIDTLNKKMNAFESIRTASQEKVKFNDASIEKFLQMAETLANAKVNHNSFKSIMKEQFEKLFLNQD